MMDIHGARACTLIRKTIYSLKRFAEPTRTTINFSAAIPQRIHIGKRYLSLRFLLIHQIFSGHFKKLRITRETEFAACLRAIELVRLQIFLHFPTFISVHTFAEDFKSQETEYLAKTFSENMII